MQEEVISPIIQSSERHVQEEQDSMLILSEDGPVDGSKIIEYKMESERNNVNDISKSSHRSRLSKKDYLSVSVKQQSNQAEKQMKVETELHASMMNIINEPASPDTNDTMGEVSPTFVMNQEDEDAP